VSAVLEILAGPGLWEAVLRIATPFVLGTLGVLLCERAGVLNLGVEGIMTFGAMIGWLTVYAGGGLWAGVLAASACGAAFGLVHAALTVPLGLNQHVTGLGITLLASSASYYAFRLAVPTAASPPTIEPFRPLAVPLLSDLPVLGPALFVQAAPTYLALLLVGALAWLLYRTPLGLAIRMTGENPHAAEAQGLDPIALRIGAVMAGSALMGMAGAFLTLVAFNSFFPGMVQGRGWVCVALVVFALWRPGRALLGAVLFAFFDAFQLRLQTAVEGVPYQLFLMLPYLLSILALIVMARRARVPQALMRPYRRGER
jgi:simple sugar transport system permease protein